MSIKLLLEVRIENVFKAKDFTDKKSGEVKIGKYKIQSFDNILNDDGSKQIKLIDVSVPDHVGIDLQDKVGETVTLEVGTYVNNGRVGYYGL